MINTAVFNTSVIYAHNMRKDQPKKKIKRVILFAQNFT